jgi:hypothetical protein
MAAKQVKLHLQQPPRTLLELDIIKLLASVMNKKNWKSKILDPEIQGKWREEALAFTNTELIDYCFKELLATLNDPLGSQVLPFTRIVDDLVSNDLKERVLQLANKLELQPKDWHPGSEEKVLDLVHPSLYCIVFGKTHATIDGKDTLIAVEPEPEPSRYYYNRVLTKDKFQWLPAEFHVDANGSVKIASYINNLHPVEYKEFYNVIESVFELCIPYLEDVVSNAAWNSKHFRVVYDSYYDENDEEPIYEPDGSDNYDSEYDERYEEWFSSRKVLPPKVPTEYVAPNPVEKLSFRDKSLQVIFKMANIHLTPEKPRYDGGSWHIEGTTREDIVATVIYYYDSSNITPSKLSFRVCIDSPFYEQNDHRGPRLVYGLEDEESMMNQVLGSVDCIEDRLLVFPNMYQHKVEPFELADPNKPGHRKIMVFFLVNPTNCVMSSKDVPFQQKEWGALELLQSLPEKLPFELLDKVAGSNPYWMDMNEAKQYRAELIESRKAIVNHTTEVFFEESFSLCEH